MFFSVFLDFVVVCIWSCLLGAKVFCPETNEKNVKPELLHACECKNATTYCLEFYKDTKKFEMQYVKIKSFILSVIIDE